MSVRLLSSVLILVLCPGLAGPTLAQEPEPIPKEPDPRASSETPTRNETPNPEEPGEDEAPPPVVFERVRVIGDVQSIDRVPGSVTYIDQQTLAKQDHFDVHRVLARVPGVHAQEEDGYGLRPNIGMRGTGVERSSKITTLEDGVLIAPAPYSAPSAYYFPTVARMAGIEVRKGSSSIRNGPFTTGGTLNFISSAIPAEFGGQLDVAVGDNDTVRGRLKLGDSFENFGWLVETFQYDTEGFKDLDGGGDTGFDLEDYLVKFRINTSPGAGVFQALELKLGKTEQLGAETYLGLTQEDFDADPYRRYAGSRQDSIDTDHEQIQANYLIRPNDRVDVTTTVYRNDFFRNWRKLEKVGGSAIADVLANPTTHAAELDILRADLTADSAADALSVRNNRREYYSEGIQTVVGITPGGDGSRHEIEVGLRYHEDEEDRFQEEDGFRMTTSGQMVLTSVGDPGSQSNRVSRAEAVAFFAQDTITAGRWTVVPGLRLETIEFDRRDYEDPGRTTLDGTPQKSSIDQWIPGVGASYEIDDANTVFVGVHRGFAPPGPGSAEADAEESVSYEAGYRRDDGRLSTELIGFYTDYDNMLGDCTVFFNCDSDQIGNRFNGGAVEVYGVEARLGYDLGQRFESRLRIPVELGYTFNHGEFRETFDSDLWGRVFRGDELPYLPEHQIFFEVGLVDRAWSVFTSAFYVDESRTGAGQGSLAESESTDGHLLVDLTATYRLRSTVAFRLRVRNLTDEEYVAARRPAGLRPGIDRTVLAGITFDF